MRDSLKVKIVKIRPENPEVTTLYFTRPFQFVAGQYITVFISGSRVKSGKAYSLSSRPIDELASITVKNVGGEFSSYLCSRQLGDEIFISRPYGFFNPQTAAPLVGIVAGCGLSPIWSVMSQAGGTLYFAHKSPEFTLFDKELEDSAIDVHHFSTRQQVFRQGWQNGRFKVDEIVANSPNDAHFLVCGSVEFVKDVWQKLTQNGIDNLKISTETFFE